MTHEEFMSLYDDSLRHSWVTSKIASIAAKQKEREKEYNSWYYRMKKKLNMDDTPADQLSRATDKALGRSDLEIGIHDAQRKFNRATDTISDSIVDAVAEAAGKSPVERAAILAKRIADREAVRIYDAGIRAVDRLSGKSELEVVASDIKRKASRALKKGEDAVRNIIKYLQDNPIKITDGEAKVTTMSIDTKYHTRR